MTIKYRGEELTPAELQEIADNFYISKHAKERLRERGYVNIRDLVLNPLVAYFNTDGSINVAQDEYNYLVFVWSERHQNFTLVTWKEESWYGKTVFDKQKMAKNGYERKLDR